MRGELVLGDCADCHAMPVVGEDVEFDDLIDGERAGTVELGHHRMHAAGVVADHAAEGVAVVGRRDRDRR